MSYREQRMRVVSVNDPAIDTMRMTAAQMIEYYQTRDYNLIAQFFKPGIQPTVYHIEEVPRRLWNPFVRSGDPGKPEEWERCFRAGVKRIQHLRQRDGSTLVEWEPPTDAQGIIKMESMDRVSKIDSEEIGAVVWYHSFLDPTTRHPWQLPPTCQEVLAPKMFRRADLSPSSPESSKPEASSEPAGSPETPAQTAPSSGASAASSGSPTAATAAETQSTGA